MSELRKITPTDTSPARSICPKINGRRWKPCAKDKINVLYCYSVVGHLAATAGMEFVGKGYPIMELDGGWRWWKDDAFEIEK